MRDVDHELGNASINENEALEENNIYFLESLQSGLPFEMLWSRKCLRSIRVVISKVPRLTQYEMFKIIYKLMLGGA